MDTDLIYDAIDVIEILCDCIRDAPASCDACYLNEYPETCKKQIELLRNLKNIEMRITNELYFFNGLHQYIEMEK